jgi:hypothetical protein
MALKVPIGEQPRLLLKSVPLFENDLIHFFHIASVFWLVSESEMVFVLGSARFRYAKYDLLRRRSLTGLFDDTNQ